MPSLHVAPPTKKQREQIDHLYSQNLSLGHQINSLNDENNFYKIQINNFNKLTASINKDLYKLGLNFQNRDRVEESMKVGPLFIISNKVKLKNIQMKIGNSIRDTEKLIKRNFNGSIPLFNKKIQTLQKQLTLLIAKYTQLREQNELLRNIQYHKQVRNIYQESLFSQFQIANNIIEPFQFKEDYTLLNLDFLQDCRLLNQKFPKNSVYRLTPVSNNLNKIRPKQPLTQFTTACNSRSNTIHQRGFVKKAKSLETDMYQSLKTQAIKKIDVLRKQQKRLKKILEQLQESNTSLKQQTIELKSQYPINQQQVYLDRVKQANQLQRLQIQQKKLLQSIAVETKELEEQYTLNKQCKQRINDKKYQENKEMKVLQEQVMKCREQLKQFKQKYKQITTSGMGSSSKDSNHKIGDGIFQRRMR